MTNEDSQPKIHIDSDWKAEAQKEKERLAAKEAQSGPGKAGEQGLPEPNFQALVSVLASQALMGLGAYGDPKSNKVMIDLEGSRFSIDLLAVLEEKTKGNLTDEESQQLTQLVNELRNRYVQIAQLVAEQQAGGDASQPAQGGGKSDGGSKPNLEI